MKKLIFLVLLLLLAGGGTMLFLKITGAGKKHKKEVVIKPHETLELPEFVVNLADVGRPHYLKATITLEIEGKGVSEKMKESTPYVRDSLITILSKHHYTELLTLEGKNQLRTELLRGAQSSTEHDAPPVTGILFTSFVMD
jgi:flagellar protein FliL